MRAGGSTLTLLGAPRVIEVLNSLASGPRNRKELRAVSEFPPESTLRAQLTTLEKRGTIRRHESSDQGPLEYELTGAGRQLLAPADALTHWLARAPGGPVEAGGSRAKAAVQGIVEGWNAAILIQLANGPQTLTELDKRVPANYPTIERALTTMRLAGQLTVALRSPRGTPYSLSDWTRRGFVPLAFAARWEHENDGLHADPTRLLDLTSALAIVAPLLEVPADLSGVCQVAVRHSTDGRPRRSLGVLEVGDCTLALTGVYADRQPDAWASGTAGDWFSSLIDGRSHGLRVRGDRSLVEGVLDCLHGSLFSRTGIGKVEDIGPA